MNKNAGTVFKGKIEVQGTLIAHDQIIKNIQKIYKLVLTPAEIDDAQRQAEHNLLQQGVGAYLLNLQNKVSDRDKAPVKGEPYKGLLEYRLNDSDLFHGRKFAIKELVKRLNTNPLTVLHAESGAGKTSLILAGIFPQLIFNNSLPIYLRPYDRNPADVIKNAFITDLDQTPVLKESPLRDFLTQVCNILRRETPIYIFLDQFEEFFREVEGSERSLFISELAECLEDENLNVRWVLALRTEFFGNLAGFEPRIRHPFENAYRLERFTRDEAYQVVTQPIERLGICFESNLVEVILDELGKTEIAPPQLQLVCSALYGQLKDAEKDISLEYYEKEGRAAGILRGYLQRVLTRDIQSSNRRSARLLLEALVDSEKHRVRKSQAELESELKTQDVSPQTLAIVLEQLVNGRLVRVEEVDDDVVYELVHDYLLSEIELDPIVQVRKGAQELLNQELRAYRHHKTLITEERLAVIVPHLGEIQITSEARVLIEESRQAIHGQKIQSERRQRTLFVGIACVAVLMTILAWFGYNSAQRATNQAQLLSTEVVVRQTAEAQAVQDRQHVQDQNKVIISRQLASQALNLANGQYDLALLLAVQAHRMSATHQSQAALLEVLEFNPRLQAILNHSLHDVDQYIEFSPDGKMLASSTCIVVNQVDLSCKQTEIDIWNVNTGELISPIFHDNTASLMAFSPNGKNLALVVSDSSGYFSVVLWSIAEQKIIGRFDHNANDLVFTPDGGKLITVGFDNKINIWDIATGKKFGQSLIGHQGYVITVAIDPTGNVLATGGTDGTIIFWDLTSQKIIGLPIYTDGTTIIHLAFSSSGQQLVSVSNVNAEGELGNLILWDVNTQAPLYTQKNNTTYRGAVFSPYENILAYANGNKIIIIDTSNLEKIITLSGQPSYVIAHLAFSQDGHTLASTDQMGNLILWDLNSNQRLQHLISSRDDDWVQALKFIPNTQSFATTWLENSKVDLWDITSGQHTSEVASGESGGRRSLAISPDNRILATGGNQKIFLWDLEQKKELGLLTGHKGTILGLDFSPDGAYLISSSFDDEGIMLWDVKKKTLVTTFTASDFLNGDQAAKISFSPDGKSFAACGTGKNIVIWEIASKRKQVILIAPSTTACTALEYSPDGSIIVINNLMSGSVKVVSVADGKVVKDLSPQNSGDISTGLAFSPNGEMLAVAFCADLASNCPQGNLTFWDMRDFQPLGQFPLGSLQSITGAIDFSPDGRILVTGDSSGKVIAWDINLSSWLYRACKIANRNLSMDEWTQYIGNEYPYALTCPELPAGEGVSSNIVSTLTTSDVDEQSPSLFQLPDFASLTKTPGDELLTKGDTKVVPPGGWKIEVGNLPDHIEFTFPAMIQCRESANSDQYLQQFFGIFALRNTQTDQWIYKGNANIILLNNLGNEIARYPIGFSSGNNTISWLMADDTYNKNVPLVNDVSSETVIRLEVDSVEWQNINGHAGDYKANINIESQRLFGNPQYPQHMVVFSVDNIGKYVMSNLNVFVVVQDSKGETVDILRSSTSNLGSGEGGYFIAKSLSQSGRCVGPIDEKGYILHYWVSYVTEDEQTGEFYGVTDLNANP